MNLIFLIALSLSTVAFSMPYYPDIDTLNGTNSIQESQMYHYEPSFENNVGRSPAFTIIKQIFEPLVSKFIGYLLFPLQLLQNAFKTTHGRNLVQSMNETMYSNETVII